MKQPKFWKTLKRHPLSAEYADLSGPEWNEFLSLMANGYDKSRPIVLFDGMVLDGWQRQRACVATDTPPVYVDLPKGWHADAFVEMANDRRRHETPETRTARIEARRARVAQARSEGQSLRAIAEQEKVDPKTVRNDLKTSGGDQSPPDTPKPSEPPKVKGRDGKTYQSAKPKPPKPEPPTKCDRCQRVGRDDPHCPKCYELRNGKAPKAGKPRFDEKRLTKVYGELVRVVDDRLRAMGGSKHHKKCQDLLGLFLAEYQVWMKAT